MAAEWPAAEVAMMAGDSAGARDVVPRCSWHRIPEWREEDTLAMDCARLMRSRIAQGSQVEVLRMRCAALGLGEAAVLELFERAALVDRVEEWWASHA